MVLSGFHRLRGHMDFKEAEYHDLLGMMCEMTGLVKRAKTSTRGQNRRVYYRLLFRSEPR